MKSIQNLKGEVLTEGTRVRVIGFCEVEGMTGTVRFFDAESDMPVMVDLDNGRQWPFAANELERIPTR